MSTGVAEGAGTSMPDEETVEREFTKVLSKIQNIPAAAAKNLPLDKKWLLVLKFKSSTHDEPADFVKQLQVQIKNPNWTKLRQMKIDVSLGARDTAWTAKFLSLDGQVHLFALLEKLMKQMENERDSTHEEGDVNQVDEEKMAVIASVAKSMRNLSLLEEGIESVTENPEGIQVLVRSLDYINLEATATVLKILAAVAFHTMAGHAEVCAALEQFIHGSTFWAKIVSLLDEDDDDVRIANVILINVLLMTDDQATKSRLVATLSKFDLADVLQELEANSEDDALKTLMTILRENNPSFNVGRADDTYSGSGKTPAQIFSALDEALGSSQAYHSWQLSLDHLMMLEKSGARGEGCWQHVESFLRLLATRQVMNDDVKGWFDGALHAASSGGSDSGESDHANIVSEYENRIDQLNSEIDNLTHQLEDAEKAAAEAVKAAKEAASQKKEDPPPKPKPKYVFCGECGSKNPYENDDCSVCEAKIVKEEEKPKEEEKKPEPEPEPAPAPTVSTEVCAKCKGPLDATPDAEPAAPAEPAPPPPPAPDAPPPPPAPGAPPPPPAPGAPPPPPAPGAPGAPPPPPGPPGAPGAPPAPGMPMVGGRPKKPNVAPRTKMRGLPWQTLPPIKVGDTFWETADESKILAKLPRKDLENLFAAKLPKKSTFKRKATHEKPKELILLDGKRANNVTIMLSRFKMPFTQIRKALVSVNVEVFDLEKLLLLRPFLPTQEEIMVLKGYEGDRGILGRAERLFMELMKIPRLEQRMDAMIFRGTFEKNYEKLNRQITSVIHAIDSLRNSELFKEVLKIILALGNYLNGGSFRGGAYGFKLSTLNAVLNFKGNDGSPMIEFLVRYIKKKHKAVMKWTTEVGIVSEVVDINMSQVIIDGKAMVKGMRNCVTEKDQPSELANDGLSGYLSDFVTKAGPLVDKLDNDMSEMETKFVELAKYYGDQSKKEQSEEFFQMIDGFIRAFKGTDRRLRLAKEKKKRDNKRKLKPKMKAKPPPPRKETNAAEKQKILNRLKSPRNMKKPPPTPKKPPK